MLPVPAIKKLIVTVLITVTLVNLCCKHKTNTGTASDTTDTALLQFRHHFNGYLPQPVDHVNDYENIFSAEEELRLNQMMDSFATATTIEFALVSIDTSMISRRQFDNLTLQLANAWGVGQKGKNNAVLIGISAGYRRISIQNGKGIEKIFTDFATKSIIDADMVPRYKEGDYFAGTVDGLYRIMQVLTVK